MSEGRVQQRLEAYSVFSENGGQFEPIQQEMSHSTKPPSGSWATSSFM